MFVTSHITFGQLSNFVGPSFEITRTISNNKLHFTWGCFNLLLKRRKRALTPISFVFFLNDADIFLKYLNSNHNLPSYSLFSKCFSWFFYLGVHRSTGAFLRFFFLSFYFLLLLSRVTRSRARFLHIKTNGKNKLSF